MKPGLFIHGFRSGDPLLRGMVRAFLHIDRVGKESYDLISGAKNTLVGTEHEVVDRPLGSAFRRTTTNNGHRIELPFAVDPNYGGPFTAVVVFHTDAFQGNDTERLLLHQNDGSGLGRNWIYIHGDSSNNVVGTFLGGTSLNSGITPSVGKMSLAAVRYTGAVLHIGANGDWSPFTNTRSMEGATGTHIVADHKSSGGRGPSTYPIYSVYLWERFVANGELDELYDEPFRPWSAPGTLILPVGVVAVFPDSPPNLTATAVSVSQIDLDWDEVQDATGYDIERDGVIVVKNHLVTSYSDTGLSAGTTYSYRVRAVQE